jgi:hypothetical protein
MEIRNDPSEQPLEISTDEFKQMVGEGKIGPKTLVRGKFSTDGVWRTADNVRLFHRCSPTRYPFGEHLLAEEQKDELRQAELDKLAAIRAAYMHGDLIEEIYNVRKMLDLTSEPGVIGAARLIVCPSFHPERIVTVVFAAAEVRIEAIKGSRSLWFSLPQLANRYSGEGAIETQSAPFSSDEAVHLHRIVGIPDCQFRFVSWDALSALARMAPSCSSLMTDGIAYRHKVVLDTGVLDATWLNPEKEGHPRQVELVREYLTLMQLTGLDLGDLRHYRTPF